MEDFYEFSLPRWYNFLTKNHEIREQELCKKYLKDRALLKFQLVTSTVARTTQDLRLTLTDKISNFGSSLYNFLF